MGASDGCYSFEFARQIMGVNEWAVREEEIAYAELLMRNVRREAGVN